MEQTAAKITTKKPKIKLDFKIASMRLAEEKNLLQKFGLKKELVKFMLMAELWMIISRVVLIKCKLQDHLKL